MWKMTNEDTGVYSSTVTLDFEKRMTTYTDSEQTNSTPLYGDGELAEVAVSEGQGTLSIGVHHHEENETQRRHDQDRQEVYRGWDDQS